jgi:hypothetical protein
MVVELFAKCDGARTTRRIERWLDLYEEGQLRDPIIDHHRQRLSTPVQLHVDFHLTR